MAISNLLHISRFVALLSLTLISSVASAGNVKRNGKASDGIYLSASLSEGKSIVGAPVLYEVSVVAPAPDLTLLSVPQSMDWGGLSVAPAAGDSRFHRVVHKGKEMYEAVIARYWITGKEAGKFSIAASSFTLGIPKERIVRDPFWGSMRQSFYEELPLETPSISLKVDNLPGLPKDFPFSGAVGEYEVSVWIPEGYIAAGQEAIAVVNISGWGSLAEADIPVLTEAFSGSVRLKSVREDRSSYIKDGKLCSEIELEVTFIPNPDENGESVIAPVPFGYFSPSDGKYKIAKSDAVSVPFGSSSRKKSSPDQFGV